VDHLVRGLRLASEHAPVGARCPGAGGSHRTERLGGRHAGGAQGLVRGGGAGSDFCALLRTESRPRSSRAVRGARRASDESWVTTIRLSLRSFQSRSMMATISMRVVSSRLPVGSSARMTLGFLTSARAMPTRSGEVMQLVHRRSPGAGRRPR